MSHPSNQAICLQLGAPARAGPPGQSAAREAPSRRSAAEPRLAARAALIYQHRRADRQHQIADALSKLAEDELSRAQAARDQAARKSSGTQRARTAQTEDEKPE